VRSALVLQGGGALGAYELGAARALYKENRFSPDLIAGVSIGAITAVILARLGYDRVSSKNSKPTGSKLVKRSGGIRKVEEK
jgi:predicted acylesterase/phospholipase RssA